MDNTKTEPADAELAQIYAFPNKRSGRLAAVRAWFRPPLLAEPEVKVCSIAPLRAPERAFAEEAGRDAH